MSDLTEIKRISDATGATFSDAKEAYYSANGDYALAVSNISGGSYKNSYSYNDTASYNGGANEARSWFENFLASELTLSAKPGNSVSLPLILAAVIGVVCIEFIVPAVIIAYLAGVGFKFSGPVFKKDIVFGRNTAADTGTQEKAYDYSRQYDYNKQYDNSRQYDYRAEFERQEARRRASEAMRNAQSVKYEMPPKYEYDYAYARTEQNTETGHNANEEKGFF